MTSRRNIIKGAAALSAGLLLPGISFASLPTDKRYVFIILRGGMDGLSAVPAHGDPDYYSQRGDLAIPSAYTNDKIIDIDGFFGFGPHLKGLKKLYDAKELAVIHSVGIPFKTRSHFDAQNLLENGSTKPHGAKDGWLNRMIKTYPDEGKGIGLAASQQIPLIMQGDARIASWKASQGNSKKDLAFMDKVLFMYAKDPLLSAPLKESIKMQKLEQENKSESFESNFMANVNIEKMEEIAAIGQGENMPEMMSPTQRQFSHDPVSDSMRIVGNMLAKNNGPRVAVVESGGWDTHAKQQDALYFQHRQLANTLSNLRTSMKKVWNDTVITVVTEFGRTVRQNGTGGTDHGTASVAFVIGGKVNGGKFYVDWPGLSSKNLFEGRDLMPTMDMRRIFRTVLHHHLEISTENLNSIFPDSNDVKFIDGLIR